MSIRRVLILSITLLAAAGAGYGLLGLKTPKQAPAPPAAPAVDGRSPTIIAVGPDGTLYAIQPSQSGPSARGYGEGGSYPRQEGGRHSHGYDEE